MAGPQNAVMGDDNYGTDLPQTVIPDAELQEVKSMASYAKGKEFQRIKASFEQRIAYYQQFLPDGRPVKEIDPELAGRMWPLANAIIGELQYVIGIYESAEDALNARRKGA
jgi:hypothetical protein